MVKRNNTKQFYYITKLLKIYTTKVRTSFPAHELIEEVHPDKPLIFILIDGLGESYLKRLPASSFLRSSRKESLLSVFPSTTASALTSFATGLPPALHGITGRYTYHPEYDIQINTLAFRERFGGALLNDRLSVTDLWPYPSFLTESEIPAYSIIPEVLCRTPFEDYLCGQGCAEGYSTIDEAVGKISDHVKNTSTRSLFFLYLWELDSLGHSLGTKSEKIDKLLILIDRELEKLWERLGGKASLIISADHGQIDAGLTAVITPSHRLMQYLATPPFGEPRAVQLRVPHDRSDEFEAYFNETFGHSFTLLPVRDNAALFGADAFSAHASVLFGDYVAAAKGNELMLYSPDNQQTIKRNKGEHGGMTEEERLIPLIIPD